MHSETLGRQSNADGNETAGRGRCASLLRLCVLGAAMAALSLGALLFLTSGAYAASEPPAVRPGQLLAEPNSPAACTPTIVITLLPQYGSFDNLRGTAECADPAAYVIAPYIYVSGWWTKPYFAWPTVPIAADGSWAANITTGGSDQNATRVAVFLIPAAYSPPIMGGGATLPAELFEQAATWVIADRAPSFRTLDFAGYRWRVKASTTLTGPGPNYFSDAEQDVFVDAAGHLHLALANRSGRWYSSEVVNMLSLGYGVYTYTVAGPIDQIDRNAVLGMFTWDDAAPEENYREIDFEFARWGEPTGLNAQYVVQPYTTEGNRHRFDLVVPAARSRHILNWSASGIYFRTEVEDPQTPGQWLTVHDWTYGSADNPAPGLENPRVNFWLLNGWAPSDGQPAEVVIEDFAFTAPAPSAVLSIDKAGSGLGNVAADAGGIDCGLDCAEDYALGTTLLLTATPQIGSAFLGWQGACSGSGACSLTLNANTVVTTTFMPLARLIVTRSGIGTGVVASEDGRVRCGAACAAYYAQGAAVTLTATGGVTSVFSTWSGACVGTAACVLTLAGDTSVDARFDLRTHDLTVALAGPGSGSVTSQPAGIACGADCAEAYPDATVVTLTAAAGPGSTLAGWAGCAGSGPTCQVVMTAGRQVTATFGLQQTTLAVTKEGRGQGLVTSQPPGIDCGYDCAAVFPCGAQVTLTAAAAPASAFAGWSGACAGSALSCTVTVTEPQSAAATFALDGAPMNRALQHLANVMDQYHTQTDIYTDVGAAGNHFAARGRLGSDVAMNESFTGTVHSGATAIRNVFVASGANWGGWYFLNGILEGQDRQPRPNWGDVPNAGVDLTGATQLTFYARGEAGGEKVEFFALGVGRNPFTGNPEKPYPDSGAKTTTCGYLISPCYLTLDTTWRQYSINLSGVDLRYVLGGFGWATNAISNSNRSIAFYLDDIRINLPALDQSRFLVSYQMLGGGQDFDTVHRNTAFVYDNALALLAFTAAGDWERSRLLADAFVYALEHDRFYSDHRLRSAYQAGDLLLPPGWLPNGRANTVRMPGWWDPAGENWYEDAGTVSTYTGEMAWVLLALLNYYERQGGDQYLDAAVRLATWIENETRDSRGAGGYTAGYFGWEPAPVKLLYKATEHNLDIYVAFLRLAFATRDPAWKLRAEHARTFVEAMWNPEGGFYATGTLADGVTVNNAVVPLDAQTWAVLAFGPNKRTLGALDYAERHHVVRGFTIRGFDFNTDRDQPWFEGTAQAVVAYGLLGRSGNVAQYLQTLRSVQLDAPHANGMGIVAALRDGLTTGFAWLYHNRLHTGATAWFVLAEMVHNPYWPGSIHTTSPADPPPADPGQRYELYLPAVNQ